MKTRLFERLAVAAVLVAAGWSSNDWAQTKTPRIGVLYIQPEEVARQWHEPFHRLLKSQGWTEGKNVAFVYASAHGDPSRFAEGAAELVRLKVDVIFADSAPAVRAAHPATRTIPIVGFDFTTDPVVAGYAESYSRPGGNLTGVFLDAPDFAGKWIELLKTIVPGLSRVVILRDPSPGEAHLRAVQSSARSFGLELEVLEVRKPEEIDRIGSAMRSRPQALIVLPSPMLYAESARLAKLAMKQRLPATSWVRRFAEAGGLVSYGPNQTSTYERCAALVGRILGGAAPTDLPIERPDKFDLVVNLKTAKALNLTVPESVLARADKVIR